MNQHLILGLVLIIFGASAVVILSRQASFTEAIAVPLRTILSSFGVPSHGQISASPHAGSVAIDFVSLGVDPQGDETYVTVRVVKSPEGYIDVTGWTLRSFVASVRIPQAQDFQTATDVLGDIFLRDGSTLTLYAGESKGGDNRRISQDEWIAWVDKAFLPFPRGSITLLDREGKVVDEYVY